MKPKPSAMKTATDLSTHTERRVNECLESNQGHVLAITKAPPPAGCPTPPIPPRSEGMGKLPAPAPEKKKRQIKKFPEKKRPA